MRPIILIVILIFSVSSGNKLFGQQEFGRQEWRDNNLACILHIEALLVREGTLIVENFSHIEIESIIAYMSNC